MENRELSHRLSLRGVDLLSLYGHNDANLLALEDRYGVRLTARGDQLNVQGPQHKVQHVSGLLEEMISCLRRGDQFDPLHLLAPPPENCESEIGEYAKPILSTPKILIRPRSRTQVAYSAAIEDHDIVFGIGPAGTGKNLSGSRSGCCCTEKQTHLQNYPDATSRRSWRNPGISSGRYTG